MRSVDPPIPATALIADLRNFTPNLNASRADDTGRNTFCDFLATFYGDCLEACLVALPRRLRADPPVYASSTGDGALVVFRGEDHFISAFLAAIVMDGRLARRTAAYATDPRFAGAPGTGYGIGVESGEASRVQTQVGASPVLDTYIGHCVNIAARAEAITKTLAEANTLFADTVIERVSQALLGRTYAELRAQERAAASDAARIAVHEAMHRLNHELCVAFLSRHLLRGVVAPMPLYRLARTAMLPGVARFDRLLGLLTRGDAEHLAEIRAVLEKP